MNYSHSFLLFSRFSLLLDFAQSFDCCSSIMSSQWPLKIAAGAAAAETERAGR